MKAEDAEALVVFLAQYGYRGLEVLKECFHDRGSSPPYSECYLKCDGRDICKMLERKKNEQRRS